MKSFLGAALVLSVLLNVFCAYRLLDMGITVTYSTDYAEQAASQLTVMEKLFPALLTDRSRARLLSAAKEAGLETFEKVHDNMIVVETVGFLLPADEVTAVQFD